MSDCAQKRKQGPGGGGGEAPAGKRNKGGNGGRWKTPHQKAKMAERVDMGAALDVGDGGIWVTYARNMHTKAVREFKQLCDEYGERLYDIKPAGAADEADEPSGDEAPGDGGIEACIERELSGMRERQRPRAQEAFSLVATGLECLFFMKMAKPVDPVRLARSMCEDARDCAQPRLRKCRYINRLTPVADTDRATEKGIVRVARRVLAADFALREEGEGPDSALREDGEGPDSTMRKHGEDKGEGEGEGEGEGQAAADSGSPCTYAIRYNIRNHTAFKSSEVISMIANLIQDKHKVSLGNPDKVILVEVFQLFCGVSVVDGKQWEALKRYNLNALYEMARPETGAEEGCER